MGWQDNQELQDFYPRPPRGGRLSFSAAEPSGWPISIHALREEGDGSYTLKG